MALTPWAFSVAVLYPFPSDPLSLNNKINLYIMGQKRPQRCPRSELIFAVAMFMVKLLLPFQGMCKGWGYQKVRLKKNEVFIHFTRELDVSSECARSHSVGCVSPAPASCELGGW